MKLKIRRLLAGFIDYLVCIFVPYFLLKTINNCFDNEIISKLLFHCFQLSILFLICIKDLIFKNQSLGKKILNLYIYDENENKVTNKLLLLKRNFINILFSSIYPFMILINNKSIGDYKYKTSVEIE